jgi:hypothetical protein
MLSSNKWSPKNKKRKLTHLENYENDDYECTGGNADLGDELGESNSSGIKKNNRLYHNKSVVNLKRS